MNNAYKLANFSTMYTDANLTQCVESFEQLVSLWPLERPEHLENHEQYYENLVVRSVYALAQAFHCDVSYADVEYIYEGGTVLPRCDSDTIAMLDTLCTLYDAIDRIPLQSLSHEDYLSLYPLIEKECQAVAQMSSAAILNFDTLIDHNTSLESTQVSSLTVVVRMLVALSCCTDNITAEDIHYILYFACHIAKAIDGWLEESDTRYTETEGLVLHCAALVMQLSHGDCPLLGYDCVADNPAGADSSDMFCNSMTQPARVLTIMILNCALSYIGMPTISVARIVRAMWADAGQTEKTSTELDIILTAFAQEWDAQRIDILWDKEEASAQARREEEARNRQELAEKFNVS